MKLWIDVKDNINRSHILKPLKIKGRQEVYKIDCFYIQSLNFLCANRVDNELGGLGDYNNIKGRLF